jgi:hypothetical protein
VKHEVHEDWPDLGVARLDRGGWGFSRPQPSPSVHVLRPRTQVAVGPELNVVPDRHLRERAATSVPPHSLRSASVGGKDAALSAG